MLKGAMVKLTHHALSQTADIVGLWDLVGEWQIRQKSGRMHLEDLVGQPGPGSNL